MVIPIRGQYEQLCNAESLKKLGIYVGVDINDVRDFMHKGKSIKISWDDPSEKIISEIVKC